MKKRILLISFILVGLFGAGVVAQGPNPVGTWTSHFWFRKPPLAPGTETYFNDALDKLDAWLNAQHVLLGQQVPTPLSYDTLADAVNTIGSVNPTTLQIPSGTWPVPVNLTVPPNIRLVVDKGANIAVSSGATLTIQGPIDAGPYQIFSWTGTGAINLTASPTKRCYLQWWGATPGTITSGTDISPALLMAYQSLTNTTTPYYNHEIVRTNGFWWLNTPMVFVPTTGWYNGDVYPPDFVGEQEHGSPIVMNVGGTNDGISIGGTSGGVNMWIQTAWIRNLDIIGGANCCRHALNLENWNQKGGTENVNIQCGSTSSAVFMTSIENCDWQFSFGFPSNSKYYSGAATSNPYAGVEVDAVAGVGNDFGAGTFNRFRVRKTFNYDGIYALKLSNSGNCYVEAGDIETCSGGEVQDHYVPSYMRTYIKLYSGSNTKVAQTFTLSQTTTINNIGFYLQAIGNPTGPVKFNIYSTSSGPNASIYSCWKILSAADIATGGGMPFLIPTAQQSLAAGTYAAEVEYSGGDASNYIQVGIDASGTGPGTCYVYSGSSWGVQTGTSQHVVNADAAIWLYKTTESHISATHMESNWMAYIIDDCQQITIDSAWVGAWAQITRSKYITLGGSGSYFEIDSDPVSTLVIDSQRSARTLRDTMSDYGNTIYRGYYADELDRVPLNVKGNNFSNLCPNTLFDRWQTGTVNPDGWITPVPANYAWTKDTSHNINLTPNCAKLVFSGSSLDQNLAGPPLTGASLSSALGRYVNFSIYARLPAGQTWATYPFFFNVGIAVPNWAQNTPYAIGAAVNGGSTICVQPGTSGSGSQPPWATGYQTDGTVVWLTYSAGGNSQQPDTSWSDDVYRRMTAYQFIPTNCTQVQLNFSFKPQVSGNTTVYFALPMWNYGLMPGMAPAPIALLPTTQSLVVGANHIDYDGYIPTSSSSKLYGMWASVGDMVINTGVTASTTPAWFCTTAGFNGSGAAWTFEPVL